MPSLIAANLECRGPRAVLAPLEPGAGALAFRRVGDKTVVETVAARSPTKLLTPRNHGHGAWVFVASFGGGLVDGDGPRLTLDVHEGATALLGTQASTKVYRATSPHGCSQTLVARVAAHGTLVVVPDPVTCFADARYRQDIEVTLAPDASLLLVDGLTSGRSARGERWAFARYASRVRVVRDGAVAVNDTLVLDPAHGSVAARMERFDILATAFAIGPKLTPLRQFAFASIPRLVRRSDVVQATSALGGGARGDTDAALLRIGASSVECGLTALRAHLAPHVAALLGDNPFVRKW
jgi:urease accessory protein